MDEKEARKAYLAKLNRVVDLAREILGGEWNYRARLFAEWHRKLAALGKITNLQQVKKIVGIGWEVGETLGNYGGLEYVGDALVQSAEHYYSRYSTQEDDMRRVDDWIAELEKLVRQRKTADE